MELFQIKDLFEKYGLEIGQKIFTQHLKRFPRKKKKHFRVIGKEKRDKFFNIYAQLSDFEKLRFVEMNWHPICLDKEFPSDNWSWALDVYFY